jgi:hypothetical protein
MDGDQRSGTMGMESTERPSQPRESRSRVGVTGLEPATFRPPDGRATKLRHTPQADLDSLSDRPGSPDQPPLPLTIDADTDALRTAVASSGSWRGVLRALGRRPDNGRGGRQLRARCDGLGIDYSHFGRSTKWTEAELRRCVPAATTWTELITELGYAVDSGSARDTLRAHCARLGIDASHLDGSAIAPEGPLVENWRPYLASAGSLIVAAAVALDGRRVSWPLEPAPYDLLVETPGNGVRRVQVKTTTQRRGATWICHLNRSRYDPTAPGSKTRLSYDPRVIDDIAIVDGDLGIYLIPYPVVAGRSAIHLSRYAQFRIRQLDLAAGYS